MAVNHLIKGALTCDKPRPRFAYIAPTFTQGKQIAWDYLKHFSQPVPGAVVNESELRIDYPNGGQVRIYGADNPDRLRGIYLDGAVLDEFGLQPPRIYSEVVTPALSDRGGWAFFIGTPNGQNEFYEKTKEARVKDGWFFREYKASQTGYVSDAELATARTNMTPDEYAQEYECSFEASVKGAVYAREITQARQDGRVGVVPYEPILPVDTYWDLGVGDATAIWFAQSAPTGEVRVLGYYENSGQGLHHYAGVIRECAQSYGYAYGNHWAPHDINVRELGTGRSRIEIAQSLGINFQVTRQLKLDDGINAARMLFPKCWFDAEKCKKGLDALQGYRWAPIQSQHPTSRPLPVHDWTSHGADAFRYLAVSYYTPQKTRMQFEAAMAAKDYDPYDERRRGSQRMSRGGW